MRFMCGDVFTSQSEEAVSILTVELSVAGKRPYDTCGA